LKFLSFNPLRFFDAFPGFAPAFAITTPFSFLCRITLFYCNLSVGF
jgi:hypothetical protein